MGRFRVRQPLPHQRVDNVDPFLLLHHAGPTYYEAGSNPAHEGVPPHPHRGFDPVTFVYKGGVHHRDSRGNDSVIGPGGVQWMTAGMGIVHSERPPADLMESGGEQEIIQLWINLPARHKMVQPRYQGFTREDLPVVESGNGAQVQVVAGQLNGVTGPVETYTPITALNASFEEGSSMQIDLPAGHAALAYVLDGEVRVNGDTMVVGHEMVEFLGDGAIQVEALTESRLLIISGEPIGEPVVSSGPYVMNTHTQIMEAMRDAQMGKMGILIEEF
jgi:redox-sensitive bicupin YhaK (pirin superfamily)